MKFIPIEEIFEINLRYHKENFNHYLQRLKMAEEGVKLILVGNAAVGKTSLVNCFLGLPFDQEVLSTNMASYQRKFVQSANGENVRLDIWDTAGQEKFRTMLPIYFRTAAIALLCFDKSNIDSIDEWYSTVYQAAPQCHIFLVLTKSDLYEDSIEELRTRMYEKGENMNISNCFITSAKQDMGIKELFEKAATVATQVELPQTNSVKFNEKGDSGKKKCNC